MGARNGSITYRLYHVNGEAESARDALLGRIGEFAFQPLTAESEDDFHYGWIVFEELLNTEFSRDNVFRGEYVCLGLRVDQWRLPSALLRARMSEMQNEVKARTGKPKLFRTEKEHIRETVTRELKGRTLPSAQMIDCVWEPDAKLVRFWSQSTRMTELFESLFESTFEVQLMPSNPYIEALEAGLDDDAVGRLVDAEPARFTSFDD